MAKMKFVAFVKNKAMAKPAAAKPGASTGNFQLLDNGNGTATVTEIDTAGNPIALDPAAVLTVASSDTAGTFVKVGAVTGATFPFTPVSLTAPGTPVVLTVTATWPTNPPAGSPFTATCAVDVVSNPNAPAGIAIQPSQTTP
jgi:hypothetical protein